MVVGFGHGKETVVILPATTVEFIQLVGKGQNIAFFGIGDDLGGAVKIGPSQIVGHLKELADCGVDIFLGRGFIAAGAPLAAA